MRPDLGMNALELVFSLSFSMVLVHPHWRTLISFSHMTLVGFIDNSNNNNNDNDVGFGGRFLFGARRRETAHLGRGIVGLFKGHFWG